MMYKNLVLKKIFLGTVLATSLALVGCGGSDNDDSYVFKPNQPKYELYVKHQEYKGGTLPEYAKSIDVMTYKMPYVNGKIQEATAMVMVPKTATQPKDGWRVVVWAHGTTGVGDACAPSNNAINPDRFGKLAKSLLEQGYIILAPDYEGLGTRGIHPYLNLESEAKSAIYAVDALKERLGTSLNGAWMSVGQSQGGHASLGIAEFAAKDPTYKGAVAAAPASSLGHIITNIAPQAIAGLEQLSKEKAIAVYAELLSYAAYTATGIRAYQADFNYTDMFQTRAANIAKNAEGTTGDNGLCLGGIMTEYALDIQKFLAENSNNKVMDYPAFVNGFETNVTVAKFLQESQPGTKQLTKPVYVVQGQADAAVPYQVTTALVQNLNNKLKSSPEVILDVVEGAGHTEAIVQRNDKVVDFIKKYMPAKP